MFEKLVKIESKFSELDQQLSDPDVVTDPKRYARLAKERSDLLPIMETYSTYKKVCKSIEEDRQLLTETIDREFKELAQTEVTELESQAEALMEKLKVLLIPKDPQDSKNVIMEIRAGTGGDEAGLFAGDLFRMYQYYIEAQGWKIDVMGSNPQGIGGFKEIIFSITGKDVFGKLKYEGGVHRVQRVPVTEASGRIHTSAASVAVLAEPEEVDIQINPNELKIDVYRSSGPGGQSVNTTDSAVRVTHLPSGMVVTCQDEKSQHKNKAKAIAVLRARLYDKRLEEESAKITATRRSMISSGDRSAKIRTFNFPQNRVTDHRINLTLYKLDRILEGDLVELIEQLQFAERAEKLASND
ncbi:peptide chain release factor 1 [candidate division KSB1 bacterium]|nr:peptide chain release factor 1 [candidate division KSB1 bacterium]